MDEEKKEEEEQDSLNLQENNIELQIACEPYYPSTTSFRMSGTPARKICWPQRESF